MRPHIEWPWASGRTSQDPAERYGGLGRVPEQQERKEGKEPHQPPQQAQPPLPQPQQLPQQTQLVIHPHLPLHSQLPPWDGLRRGGASGIELQLGQGTGALRTLPEEIPREEVPGTEPEDGADARTVQRSINHLAGRTEQAFRLLEQFREEQFFQQVRTRVRSNTDDENEEKIQEMTSKTSVTKGRKTQEMTSRTGRRIQETTKDDDEKYVQEVWVGPPLLPGARMDQELPRDEGGDDVINP